MNRLILSFLFASFSLAVAGPPEEDRRAILAMAGKFNVTFDFKETVSVKPSTGAASPAYHEEAHEVVVIAEDTPERIVLQHLLVVGASGKTHVIKHWAQVWTWQDTDLLDYAGSEGNPQWNHLVVSAAQAAGKWSQLVTNVDDSPRYEGLGRWTHDYGVSSWTSEPGRRPLPRREYENAKRSDYDYLLGTNRHTLTPDGWAHFQDSRKVVDRNGHKLTLCFESGLNVYKRAESPLSADALKWWDENAEFWGKARGIWLDAFKASGPVFTYQKNVGDVKLGRKFRELEAANPSREEIATALAPYLSSAK